MQKFYDLLRLNDVQNALEYARTISTNDKIKSLLLQAQCQIQSKELNDARSLLSKANSFEVTHPLIPVIEALMYDARGETDTAIAVCRAAFASDNQNPDLCKCIGNFLIKKNLIKESIEFYFKAYSINPSRFDILFHLASALAKFNKKSESARILREAFELDKKETLRWLPTLKLAHLVGGSTKVISYLEEMTMIEPTNVKLKLMLAELYLNKNDSQKSCSLYEEILTIEGGNYTALVNYIAILIKINSLKLAGAKLKQALNLYPNSKILLSHSVAYFALTGDLTSASESADRCLLGKDPNVKVVFQMLDFSDLLNDIKMLQRWLKIGKQILQNKAHDLIYFEAKLHYRMGNLKRSITLFQKISSEKLGNALLFKYFELGYKLHHENRQHCLAFQYASQLNSNRMKTEEYKQYIEIFPRKEISSQLNYLKSNSTLKKSNRPKAVDRYRVCFMLGFPRSGTTLLDSVLRGNKSITVLEERTIFQDLIRTLPNKGFLNQELSKFLESNSDVLTTLRAEYLQVCSEDIDFRNDCELIVDKMPLNSLYLPVITQIFPDSKIVVSLREPLDVILSNFVQNYKLNPYMAQFCDLDRTFQLYKQAIDTIMHVEGYFHDHMCFLSYENIVSDLAAVAVKVSEFLEVPWDTNMLRPDLTAQSRLRINTPSSSEVIKPVHRRNVNKSADYMHFLAGVKNRLNLYENYVRSKLSF